MNGEVEIFCSAYCKYNSCNGYYNSCEHPARQNAVPRSGLIRYHVDKCELYERPDKE